MNGIPCPACGFTSSRLLYGKMSSLGYYRRRRLCLKCGMRFTTTETVVSTQGMATGRRKAPLDVNVLRKMRRQGMTHKQIGEQLGWSVTKIWTVLNAP